MIPLPSESLARIPGVHNDHNRRGRAHPRPRNPAAVFWRRYCGVGNVATHLDCDTVLIEFFYRLAVCIRIGLKKGALSKRNGLDMSAQSRQRRLRAGARHIRSCVAA